MMEKMVESSGNVLGYKFTGTINVDDIKKMEPEVDALVQKEGNVRILFNMTGFKWEKIEALVADLKFGPKLP
jgi:HSP20 family molecular chaperone IbpA